MDATAFKTAIDEIAESKGISHDAVVEAIREALQRAYVRYLGGGDDAVVEASIDEAASPIITLAQIKTIKKDVEDDYLEISPEDAKEDAEETIEHLNEDLKDAKEVSSKADLKGLIEKVDAAKKGIKIGGTYAMYCPLGELTKLTAMAVKNNLRLKIAEAERVALYDVYKDHIGEMVTGTVEKADDRSVSVNIGRTTVELGRREMIGDEYFKVGDPIKVYIQEVKQADAEGRPTHGPQIEVTRSSEGFLKRLFEEEIHEIYDGTVIIKGIAREAGVRSKVAVMSNNEDVDPTGACIGPGGSRIQKIVSQLGNGKDKEKIDIIAYSDNPALYIAESLRPAQVLGVAIKDASALPHPLATAIVKDEQLSLAIGKKGANARLANKLTGWSIDIVEESEAQTAALVYSTVDDLQKQVEEAKKLNERAKYAEKSKLDIEKREAEAKAQKDAEQVAVPSVAAPAETVAPAPVSEGAPSVAAAPTPVAPAAPAEIKKEAPAPAPTVVKTTTTLDALEKELAESAKIQKSFVPYDRDREHEHEHEHGKFQKNKRPHQISDKEVAHVKPTEVTPTDAPVLPIYTQEELAAMAKEEDTAGTTEEAQEDVDVEQYDKYYDDDEKK
jgi:N utilization substance protein A